MSTLHKIIMAAVADLNKDNNATQKTNNVSSAPHTNPNQRPRTFFRMSSTYATTMTPALCAQLDRCCEHEGKTRSRVIRNAVYAVLNNPAKLQTCKPANLPEFPQTPNRAVIVSWTMPSNKPKDLEHLHSLCPNRGSQSNLVRQAIYIYTLMHRSTNSDEHREAKLDAWV